MCLLLLAEANFRLPGEMRVFQEIILTVSIILVTRASWTQIASRDLMHL